MYVGDGGETRIKKNKYNNRGNNWEIPVLDGRNIWQKAYSKAVQRVRANFRLAVFWPASSVSTRVIRQWRARATRRKGKGSEGGKE
jgi:hypothetical protein